MRRLLVKYAKLAAILYVVQALVGVAVGTYQGLAIAGVL